MEKPPVDVPSVDIEQDQFEKPPETHSDLGRKDAYTQQKPEVTGPPRLLVVSNKMKNALALQGALLANVYLVQYKYDLTTLDSLSGQISQHLGTKKVESICFVIQSNMTAIFISGKDDGRLNKDTIENDPPLQEFFTSLVSNHMTGLSQRMDFLSCQMAHSNEVGNLTHQLEDITGVTACVHKDYIGTETTVVRNIGEEKKTLTVGELYFREERIKGLSGHNQSLSGFEKIRTVGKGAYGTAVLYKKKDDNSLVILKEINLHDLNAAERQLALNEVRVLAMLDHPNIISYYDSFEEDGLVMIEMEYADGGTLGQLLTASQHGKSLDEKEILFMFSQMVSAIKYIHGHNILHRDLKTANIFLTREGLVKVGDFGISKLMSTSAKGASTVLGTPYYISPEMCEGKPYNDKSDMWALGCILYEMACLQKTFEGSNLPALVNKIMKGQYAPVKGNYSEELKALIMSMLQKEPKDRPSATELWQDILPQIMSRFEDQTSDCDDELTTSQERVGKNKKTRSVLYYFEMSSMDLKPIQLGSRLKIRDVSVGKDHVIAVTNERVVFTWGDGSKGQLGHGDLESLDKPKCVEALKGKSIIRVSCGDGFSVFGSDNGIVMTCGDGSSGCLGHGEYLSTSRPRLIEALLSVDVMSIDCGLHHVAAVGSEGQVFTWGWGADGRLGLGTEEDQVSQIKHTPPPKWCILAVVSRSCVPQFVEFNEPVTARSVRCGVDGTMLLTDVGSVLACGNNMYNKLGLNQRQGFLMAMKNIFNKIEVPGEKEFTVVRALTKHRVVDISMGPHHTAVVVEPGFIYTLGLNTDGQLGVGNTKPQNAPAEVKFFEDKHAFRVQCGEFYTVAGTTNNDIVYWGTRYKNPPRLDDTLSSSNGGSTGLIRGGTKRSDSHPPITPSHRRQPSTTSVNSLSSVKENDTVKDANPETGEAAADNNGQFGSGGFRPLSTRHKRTPSTGGLKDTAAEETEVILQPMPLLRLDSSGSRSQAGDTVTLSKFYCHGENLFLQVETTAPPPRRKTRRKRNFRKRLSEQNMEGSDICLRMSASSRDGGDEYSSEASEMDNSKSNITVTMSRSISQPSEYTTKLDFTLTGEIPGWLKQELADSEPLKSSTQVNRKTKKTTSPKKEDLTSGHSEEDSQSHEDSIASIHINKNLLAEGARPKMVNYNVEKRAAEKSAKVAQNKPAKSESVNRIVQKKTLSQESGVEFTVLDPNIGCSSSETENLSNTNEEDSKTRAAYAVKRVANQPTNKRITAPAPYKSKAGPAIPLSRIRAQKKTRRSEESPESDIKQYKGDIESLQSEVDRIRDEKRRTEARLKEMEDAHRQQRVSIREETELKASEREKGLKTEISALKQQLSQQSNKMEDNYDLVLKLQDQLLQVQSEQIRMSAREERPSSRASNRESKICNIQ